MRGGDKHFSHTWCSRDKHCCIEGGTKIFTSRGGQTFYVGCGCGFDDADEETDVIEVNLLGSKASKLSAAATIFRGL